MGCKLLAVDIGTSACKVALFTPDGGVCATCTAPYPVAYPAPGWAEQDPEQWWRAACAGIRGVMAKSGAAPREIAGIGIGGQSWSCVPVDKNGRVLHNSPLWMDTRAKDICARVNSALGAREIFACSGNPFAPSYTTPKILWFQEHMPQVYREARYFLQSNSFLAFRLTGMASQDVSQGYGLHMFDISKKQYDARMCRALGIDIGKLPDIYESGAVVGGLTDAAARLTGLCAGTPVVAGGLDAACGALGAGVCCPGQTQEQGGQAGGMSICLGAPKADPALILSPHVVPNLWLLQGGTVGGGGSLNWLARELGQPEALREAESGENRFALLDALAARIPPGSDGLLFLPYLAGERSPLWDPDACGVYFGLRYDKTRAHFFRALLEGAAYALEHNLKTAREAGVDTGALYAVGGAANSRLWTQIKADVTGKTVRVPVSDAATCLGAAILAGVGTGVYAGYGEAVKKTARIAREHVPDPENHGIYQSYFKIYVELYEKLKGTMKAHAALSADLAARRKG